MKSFWYFIMAALLFVAACKPGQNIQQAEEENRKKVSDAKDLIQAKEEYRLKISNTKDLMILTSGVAIELCSKHSESWRAATRERFGNIDLAILESLENNKSSVEAVKLAKATIESRMSGLNGPPEGFDSAHSKIVSVYGSFSSLIDAASSPSGALLSYNQNVNRIHEEFMKGVNELGVLIPMKETNPQKSIDHEEHR